MRSGMPVAMIRQLPRSTRAIFFALGLALSAGGNAQSIGVATWNLNWLMGETAHARWTAACARLGWPMDVDALPAADRATLAGLPFCDVHNGMAFPPEACASDRDRWPKAAHYPDDHPCRETADLVAPIAYERK